MHQLIWRMSHLSWGFIEVQHPSRLLQYFFFSEDLPKILIQQRHNGKVCQLTAHCVEWEQQADLPLNIFLVLIGNS